MKALVHLLSDSRVNQFVKLVSATPSQVLSAILAPERKALQTQLAQLDAGEASEQCFIETALKDLEVCEMVFCESIMAAPFHFFR